MRRNILLDDVLNTALIEFYSMSNEMEHARKLFDYLICRDIISCNVMISGYLRNGVVEEAINIFTEMAKSGAKPNSVTMVSLLSTFSSLGDARKGRWAYAVALRCGFHLELHVSNLILHMYARCGQIDKARMFFYLTAEKDLVSWTVMMMGYINFSCGDEAAALFEKIMSAREEPDPPTIVTLLQAQAQLGSLRSLKEIHGYTYRTCMVDDISTINSLIITYAKCGKLNIAETIFGRVTTGPGLNSWNMMIAANTMHGSCTNVLQMFNQMRRENLMPDATFSLVFSACSHFGLVDEAWRIFSSMSSYYLVLPHEEHYSCMVNFTGLIRSNVCAQDGKWNEVAYAWDKARQRGLSRIPGFNFVDG